MKVLKYANDLLLELELYSTCKYGGTVLVLWYIVYLTLSFTWYCAVLYYCCGTGLVLCYSIVLVLWYCTVLYLYCGSVLYYCNGTVLVPWHSTILVLWYLWQCSCTVELWYRTSNEVQCLVQH